jgi:hypothetical protein
MSATYSWFQVETIIEVALWAGENPEYDIEEIEGGGYEGLSMWIKDRATEFDEAHKDHDWSVQGDFYEAVPDWLTAYVVAKRMSQGS